MKAFLNIDEKKTLKVTMIIHYLDFDKVKVVNSRAVRAKKLSQKFSIFSKNIPDSRNGFFLGMKSGGDVKF